MAAICCPMGEELIKEAPGGSTQWQQLWQPIYEEIESDFVHYFIEALSSLFNIIPVVYTVIQGRLTCDCRGNRQLQIILLCWIYGMRVIYVHIYIAINTQEVDNRGYMDSVIIIKYAVWAH